MREQIIRCDGCEKIKDGRVKEDWATVELVAHGVGINTSTDPMVSNRRTVIHKDYCRTCWDKVEEFLSTRFNG